ncbi:MAG: FecR domain-containing protein [Bryobacteraceae bacterium]
MTMFDRHLSRKLAAFIDGERAPARTRQEEAHLARCARCRAELEQVRLGMSLLGRLPLAEAPETLWTSIEAALRLPAPRPTPHVRSWRLAWVAGLILVAAGVYWQAMRGPKARWEVVRLDGSPLVGSTRVAAVGLVGAGEWIETDARSRARIRIGEIGSVDVGRNTRVRVVAALPGEHRLALRSGELTASISAPPRLFFVETPAGTAVDLGCQYELQCDSAGNGRLRVAAGWVSFEWKGWESLVPAGATCHTRPRLGPGTPYFEDATERLIAALGTLDFEGAGPDALRIVLAESRIRDTLTLWHLLSRAPAGERPRVYDRMAQLSAPPAGVSRDLIMNLDGMALNRWREELAWTW